MTYEMTKAKVGFGACLSLVAFLPSCSSVPNPTKDCLPSQLEFQYSGLNEAYIHIEELSTGLNMRLGSEEDELYLARNLSKDGYVFNGWFAITPDLLNGRKFEDFSTSCQGFEIGSETSFVLCKPGSTGGTLAYLFEAGRGVTKIWWTGQKNSLVELDGVCGLGFSLG